MWLAPCKFWLLWLAACSEKMIMWLSDGATNTLLVGQNFWLCACKKPPRVIYRECDNHTTIAQYYCDSDDTGTFAQACCKFQTKLFRMFPCSIRTIYLVFCNKSDCPLMVVLFSLACCRWRQGCGPAEAECIKKHRI